MEPDGGRPIIHGRFNYLSERTHNVKKNTEILLDISMKFGVEENTEISNSN
jgi:hypothetical protein